MVNTLKTALATVAVAVALSPAVAHAAPTPVAFKTWAPYAEANMTDIASLSTRNVKVSPYFDCAPPGWGDYNAPNKTEVISVMTTTPKDTRTLKEGMSSQLNPLEHVPYDQKLVVNWRNHNNGKSGQAVASIGFGNFEFETGRIPVGAGHVTFDATFTSHPGVAGTSSMLSLGQDTIHRQWDVVMPRCGS